MTMEYDRLAEFYDLFIDEAVYDQYRILLERYTSLGTLLDIGCGTGTLSLELAKSGYLVSATDLSNEMLQIVQYRAHEEQIELEIYVYDLLDPIGRTYDTIIASMDVINHLSSLEDVQFGIQNIHDALNLHGVLVFDVLSSEYIDLLDGYTEDDEQFHFHWECHKGEAPHSIIHTVTIQTDAGKQDVTIYETTHDLARYVEIVQSVGLKILEIVTMDERSIIVAQKTNQK